MSLTQRIESDFLAAYKAKDELTVAVLRMLKTAAKNKQVELLRPITDDEMLDLVAKALKQRREAADSFRSGGREAMADREEAEMTVLTRYMPTPLSQEELAAVIEKTVSELGASSMKDMGKVVGSILSAHKGRVDGSAVSAAVRVRLSS